ncbi:MAG TPA: STAS domain-containing protein [Terriglobales bacterium]|nr:STAS domain-containing protein [Terriglobales bacterium]
MSITQLAASPTRQFSVTSEETNGSALLTCSGRLTIEVTEKFKAQVKDRFAAGKPIILDLSNVQQIDSSGLGVLVSLWVSSKTAACPLQFYNLSAPVKRLLGTTHVLKAFESCGSHLTRLP